MTGFLVLKRYRSVRYAQPGDPRSTVYLDFYPVDGSWHWTASFREHAVSLSLRGALEIARALPVDGDEADVSIEAVPSGRPINATADVAALKARKEAA